MKPFMSSSSLVLIWLLSYHLAWSQNPSVDRVEFFSDTSVVPAQLVTNLSRMLNKHTGKGIYSAASFITRLPDGTPVNDPIEVQIRGHFRLEKCLMAPLKLKFNYKEGSVLYSLKSLKLVNQCWFNKVYEQNILKEYLIYRIYNLLTDKSFRAKLLNLTLVDSAGKKKPITEYAFLLEDIKDVAKRNQCIQWTKGTVNAESTDRKQTTLVALFQYMIGNTDFSVSVNHNIKLIIPEKESFTRPLEVPYDFDYSGMVNAEYAIPDERLEIESVRQRLYRGFPRSMAELDESLTVFKQQKPKIYALINGFDLLTPKSKKEMTDYLDEFYEVINEPKRIKSIFIEHAMTK